MTKIRDIFVDGAISAEMIGRSISQHQTKTNIGAHAIFLGQVRADEKPEGRVMAIEYTAYKEMALEKSAEIREEIFSKYPLVCMHIYHSLGRVEAGQVSLFVFTSSAHRKASMQACEELVERIKNELPVWGREIISDALSSWKKNN